jgi:hypothetical protein
MKISEITATNAVPVRVLAPVEQPKGRAHSFFCTTNNVQRVEDVLINYLLIVVVVVEEITRFTQSFLYVLS